jgi:hypothetical protein
MGKRKRCSLWNLDEKINGNKKLDEVKREYIDLTLTINRMGLGASPEI